MSGRISCLSFLTIRDTTILVAERRYYYAQLDRLAKENSSSVSMWPARMHTFEGAFLSGRYPQRNGIYDMIRNEAPDYGHKYDPKPMPSPGSE